MFASSAWAGFRRVGLAAVVAALLAGCAASSADAPPAAEQGDGQALATISHLVPRPDFVGPRPDRFAWTPIAGVHSYAIGLMNEIDVMVWQTSGLTASEVAWPSGLEVPEGTYFWMVEGYGRDGRRIAGSGRAAFVIESAPE